MNNHGKFIKSLSFLLLLLPELTFLVAAQSDSGPVPPPPDQPFTYPAFSPSLAIIIAIIVTSLFFMVFFSVYLRHRSGGFTTTSLPVINHHGGQVAARGLDQSILETFPTFTYSEVKDHRIVKGALECAVCLNDFEDDETLRLIPKCDHVFHPECIDAWLEFHVTCPVCRADLVPQPGDEPVKVPDLVNSQNATNTVESDLRSGEIVIEVEDGKPHLEGPSTFNRNLSYQYPKRTGSRVFNPEKFRSYSTGYSFVQPGKDHERFTLRLPEDIRKEGMQRAILNPSRSYAGRLPREGSSRKGQREGSSRGRSNCIDRSDPEVKSDRWDFFTRAFSIRVRSPKTAAETSTSKIVDQLSKPDK